MKIEKITFHILERIILKNQFQSILLPNIKEFYNFQNIRSQEFPK